MPRTANGEIPIGQAGKDALRVDFDGSIKLEIHASKVTSDAGLVPYRKLFAAILERIRRLRAVQSMAPS